MSNCSGKIHNVNSRIMFSCVIGLALSYYAWVVEVAKEKDVTYEAMCDLSEHVSCTTAFMSKYGKGFGFVPPDSVFYVPNSIYGLVFYSVLAVTCVFNRYRHTVALVILAAISNAASLYLAWVLYLLRDICVICVSTYVVNFVILVLALRKLRIVSPCSTIFSTRDKKEH